MSENVSWHVYSSRNRNSPHDRRTDIYANGPRYRPLPGILCSLSRSALHHGSDRGEYNSHPAYETSVQVLKKRELSLAKGHTPGLVRFAAVSQEPINRQCTRTPDHDQ